MKPMTISRAAREVGASHRSFSLFKKPTSLKAKTSDRRETGPGGLESPSAIRARLPPLLRIIVRSV